MSLPLLAPPSNEGGKARRSAIREALSRLGVERFVLGIQEAALPAAAGEETGRGSLASRGGGEVMSLAHDLGFDAIQCGPGGMTTRANPSPYDGTAFSRSALAIDLVALAEDDEWRGLLPREELDRLISSLPATAADRVPYTAVYDGHLRALGRAWRELQARGDELTELRSSLRRFVAAERSWLAGDALFEALTVEHGSDDWATWPARDRRLWDSPAGAAAAAARRRRTLVARYRQVVERWGFIQWLAHSQYAAARRRARESGLGLYGDLQVGLSPRDVWRHRRLFLADYRLGAPPSRTNPRGQPWGYPVYAPELYFADGRPPTAWGTPAADRVDRGDAEDGPVLRFLMARLRRAFARYDALRIDHPHGLVCPWVYAAVGDDPHRAVQQGARLFSSPSLADHPALAAYAIARRPQVDDRLPRWHERWVGELDAAQRAAYGVVMGRAVAVASAAGRTARDLICEVLSTLPTPLGAVLAEHDLGRFRVTQKADLQRPDDVYRSENARPQDWVMMGNHDTPPIWAVIERWRARGELADRADYIASRLATEPRRRETLSRDFRESPACLADGMLADLLASPAANVFVFMHDLFGLREPYNRPGEIHPDNWLARLPQNPAAAWHQRATHGEALDIGRACALALRARAGESDDVAGLIAQLDPDRDVLVRYKLGGRDA